MEDRSARCPARLSRHENYAAAVPHAQFADLRRTNPVCWHQFDNDPGFWAAFKYRDIVAISSDTETFSSAQGVFVEDIASEQGIPGSLLTSDPPHQTALRTHFSEWFTAAAVGALEPWLRAEARTIMAHAKRLESCEFVYDMAARLPLLTICEFMGIPEADRARILELGEAVVRSQDDVAFAAAMKEIGDYGLRLADQAAGTASSPLVAKMRRSLVQDDIAFAGQFAQLLVAGNETTRTLLSNIILELCERPALFEELRTDPSLLPLAIEEFLRWSSPIYYMRRTAQVDVVLRGQAIKAGDAVVMYYASANRDEEIFHEPGTLDIRRKPNRHLAFGVGRHNCLGAQLARLETRIFLEELLSEFRGVSLAGTPKRFPSNVVNAWETIPVRFESD